MRLWVVSHTPRIGFFTDSFHEVNGVALTSRHFAAYAREQGYPFLSVHAGPRTFLEHAGPFETLELGNSRMVAPLDNGLVFDLLFWRHYGRVRRALLAFRPDLIHITGPGHMGILGALAAHHIGVPLAASWHTNVHEFAGRRLERALRFLPRRMRLPLAHQAESLTMGVTTSFYRLAKLLFAPNPELVGELTARTGRETRLMLRGMDPMFNPRHRERSDDQFVIGYVGRLSPEKNVRLLVDLESRLLAAGFTNYRFLVVGEGSERTWLADHLQRAELPGTLRGFALARAYANMDAFVFPSETDTFGNVVVEALASGVPAVVSGRGGPKYLVEPGVSGFVADSVAAFASSILLLRDADRRAQMAAAAREHAQRFSWNAVFGRIYAQYDDGFRSGLLTQSMRAYNRLYA